MREFLAMKSSTPACLTWLHLSDFHLREETGWSQDLVLNSMLEDIRTRYSGANAPDLLFLTGDLAFSGKATQYVFAEEFVRRLCAAVNVPPERLCVIPGNHDIDLDLEEDAIVGARAILGNRLEVDRLLGNEGRRKTLFARQRAFRDFANRIGSPSEPTYTDCSYAHTRTLQVGAIRVRVLLLDSTWLVGSGPSDAGALLVGERQVLDCGPPDDGCLTFALVHHPFAWLREFEQIPIEDLVTRCAHICLRGHVHTSDVRAIDGPHGRLNAFTAGAAFRDRTADNSYLWCSLDLTAGVGDQVVHRYSHHQQRWEARAKDTWTLLPRSIGTPDVAVILRALAETGVPYVSYVTCLVADVQNDVPVRLTNDGVVFVSCGATLPDTRNRCGDVIRRLRNHFSWRRVWHEASWEGLLRELLADLSEAFSELDALTGEELHRRNTISAALIASLSGGAELTSPACDEIRNLLTQDELGRARDVLERWIGLDTLRPDEALELKRLEIFLLLAEGRAPDALARADFLLSAPGRRPLDIALAARAAHDAQDHSRAAVLMHDALDADVSVDAVRTIVRRIAGATGDARLADRVRP